MEVSLQRTAELLNQASALVITGHVNPDGDCLGSMLALYYHLTALGKKVQLLLDDEPPPVYRFLPGVENIAKPTTAVQADLLVVVDASDDMRIGRVRTMVSADVLNIDHHVSNLKFADYWHLDFQAAATGEIILELLQSMDAELSADMAVCLYTAIATDCGFFRYANTSAKTMRFAARLIECGVKPHMIAEQLDAKPLASMLALQKVLDTLEVSHAGKIATITLDAALLADVENTEGFINYPRNIEGVEVAVMFKAVDESNVRVSMRSRRLDVSRLALIFGGGGHMRAAGCTVSGTIGEAKSKVLQVIASELRDTAELN